jgi:hypothetical protein
MSNPNYICLTNGTDVKRVKKTQAARLLAGGFSYCPRNKWKTAVRDKRSKAQIESEEAEKAALVAETATKSKKKKDKKQ